MQVRQEQEAVNDSGALDLSPKVGDAIKHFLAQGLARGRNLDVKGERDVYLRLGILETGRYAG